jgi:predicted Rossmann fold nucleotide-binding protein DprA/Smf involved in DNA uptake
MTAPATPRAFAEVMRDEMVMRPRILASVADGPKTIPEIAAALGAPAPEVTLWVMALRRYGALEELPKPKADDYYRYGRTDARTH